MINLDGIEKKFGVCLVPGPDAKEHFITSHERFNGFCDCEIEEIVSELRSTRERLASAEDALKAYTRPKRDQKTALDHFEKFKADEGKKPTATADRTPKEDV